MPQRTTPIRDGETLIVRANGQTWLTSWHPPGAKPGAKPGTTPGIASGVEPGTTPGTTPGTAPGAESIAPPEGTPHGASAICVVPGGDILLISPDGERWGLPGGRPEGAETWEDTLRREVQEEACATVVQARLLGFSRGICIAGHEQGLVLVRSLWRADVELQPWQPQFEIPHRRVFPASAVPALLIAAHPDGSAPSLLRALHEAIGQERSHR